MNILITGGGGFLGSPLAAALRARDAALAAAAIAEPTAMITRWPVGPIGAGSSRERKCMPAAGTAAAPASSTRLAPMRLRSRRSTLGTIGAVARRLSAAGRPAAGRRCQTTNTPAGAGVWAGAVPRQEVSPLTISRTRARALIAVAVAVGAAALLLAPVAVPRLASLVGRVSRRKIAIPRVSARAIWVAAASTITSWILYGLAFALFAHGVSPRATGNASSYIAVYTGSYLAGYLALFAPGGVGVR